MKRHDPTATGKRRPRGQLRQEILDATVALLREHQDTGVVSIDAVCTSVGCTPPTLYYYFATKDDLLQEACRREFEAFGAELENASPRTDDPRADLVGRGVAYLRWARENPTQYRLLFMTPLDDASPHDNPTAGAMPDFREIPGLRELVANLERMAAVGYEVGDVQLAAFSMWALVHGFASLAVVHPAMPQEFVEAAFESTVRNDAPSPARSPR